MFTPGITFLTLGYVVGLSIIFDGVSRIINWFEIHREAKVSGWVLASAILSLIFGFMLVGSEALQLAVDAFIVYMAIAWMTHNTAPVATTPAWCCNILEKAS